MSNITNCNFTTKVDDLFSEAVIELAKAARANALAIKAIAENTTIEVGSIISITEAPQEDEDA